MSYVFSCSILYSLYVLPGLMWRCVTSLSLSLSVRLSFLADPPLARMGTTLCWWYKTTRINQAKFKNVSKSKRVKNGYATCNWRSGPMAQCIWSWVVINSFALSSGEYLFVWEAQECIDRKRFYWISESLSCGMGLYIYIYISYTLGLSRYQ